MTVPGWPQVFPALAAGDPATRALLAAARVIEIPGGQPVFHAGGACSAYVLMLAGSIRVEVIGENGREAVLYRVQPGQSCVLTTCCMLGGDAYPAAGFTESPAAALMIAKPAFDRGLDEAPDFRRFVFANLSRRIAEVVARLEELAFRPIERRLVDYLLRHAATAPGVPLGATHQEIAVELGTAREVVSRQLKRLESAGLVRLGRSALEVLDPAGLSRLKSGAGP
jgi:CRP/FNR family transcriptional regulator, anaerobic regulatory protein